MKSKIDCSLLISTYNWPEALLLSLESVAKQSILPAEIVIADDGSRPDTMNVISEWQAIHDIPLYHVWQKDDGFRLSKIRNKAIAKCKYPYIIQVDGDIILHKDFIKDDIYIRQNGCFVTGGRVLLSPQSTEILLKERSLDIERYSTCSKNILNGTRIPFLQKIVAPRYKASGKNKFYVKGCNMAFWRKDLLAVNAYSEAFVG